MTTARHRNDQSAFGGNQMSTMTRTQESTGVTPGLAYWLSGLAVAAIWICVALASVLAPDMVTGSQHDHLAVAALGDWLWGAIATGSVAVATVQGLRAGLTGRAPWVMLALGVAAAWLAALLVSVLVPVMITGTDPTELPLAAMGAPVAAMVVTTQLARLLGAPLSLDAHAPLSGASGGGTWPLNPPAAGGGVVADRLRELVQLRDASLISLGEFESKKLELLSRI